MQERILIAPNGTELLRMLARSGISTLGLRIMHSVELAQFALMRSGVPLTETPVTPDAEAALIYKSLPEIPYFKSASLHDAQNLAGTLRTLRLQITDNERDTIAAGLNGSPFAEKNEALLKVYDAYTAALQENGMIDSVGILRYAVSRAKALSAECLVLQEYPPAPLEQAVIAQISGGTAKTVSLRELLQKDAKPLPIPQITECYGAVNEAEYIIGTIYKNKLPLDQCTVAVTDAATYAQLFFELTRRYNIPVTFGCGLPITLTNPAVVLRDYASWLTAGHCGIDALRQLLTGSAFDTAQFCEDFCIIHPDQLIETAGAMRLGADAALNAARIEAYCAAAERNPLLVAQLKEIFVNWGMDCAKLLRRYAKIRKNDLGRLDKAAQNKICDTLERFTAMAGEPADKLFSDLLQMHICKENNREGALHITSVSDALTSLRQNLFAAGLSAEKFPGEPAENYLLLDDELAAFGENAPTSGNLILQAKQSLHDLLQTAAALDIRTELSYCGYDAAELKANNASSVLFELFKEAGGTDEKAYKECIRSAGYFSQALSGMTEIGRAYLAGETVAADEPESAEMPEVSGDVRELSPTVIERYLQCPKLFCYEQIMKLNVPEQDDVFQVISPLDFGNIVHEAMSHLSGEKPALEDFLAAAEQIFDRFLTERPPMNPNDAEKYRSDFKAAVRNGYEKTEDMQIESAEQKLRAEYDCGIVIKGRPDALAKLPDGTYRILDYKTGRNRKHETDDYISCMQVMLYADMLRQDGVNVTGGDYLYLALNETVSCAYTPERAALVRGVLAEIADAMQENNYPAKASKNNCMYCPYLVICAEGGAVL